MYFILYEMILIEFIILIFSFYAIARVIDLFFIETLDIISKRLKLSSDVAGATFMAVGSSAPELFVAFLALTKISEQQAIGAGTIVGSAIFNILVIVGVSALVRRAFLTWQPLVRDMLFYIVSIIVLLITFMDGAIGLFDALIFVGIYILYLLSFKFWQKLFPYTSKDDLNQQQDLEEHLQYETRISQLSIKNILDKVLLIFFGNLKKNPKLLVYNFLLSVFFLALLSHLMVDSAVEIAHFFNVPSAIIGLTILAAGTSIPDLLSSMSVAKRGKGDMAISNAVGSNIFDIAIGLGLPWVVFILITGEKIVVATENLYSSIILLFATVLSLLFILATRRWEIGRYAGVLLIAFYIFYLITQIGWVSFSLCLNLKEPLCFSM
jgi:K+-dependent Na+/Ca+ exchanger-like protein